MADSGDMASNDQLLKRLRRLVEEDRHRIEHHRHPLEAASAAAGAH